MNNQSLYMYLETHSLSELYIQPIYTPTLCGWFSGLEPLASVRIRGIIVMELTRCQVRPRVAKGHTMSNLQLCTRCRSYTNNNCQLKALYRTQARHTSRALHPTHILSESQSISSDRRPHSYSATIFQSAKTPRPLTFNTASASRQPQVSV